MDDICTGIEDRGPHSVNLGENECPRCRINELEAQLKAVKDILYGSKSADIDKLGQIEAAIEESDEAQLPPKTLRVVCEIQESQIAKLKAQLEAVKRCRRYSYEPLHATPMLCASGRWMKADDVLTAIGEDDE
jgi:hypothetical protein